MVLQEIAGVEVEDGKPFEITLEEKSFEGRTPRALRAERGPQGYEDRRKNHFEGVAKPWRVTPGKKGKEFQAVGSKALL
jgi:hypothetical protein